MVLRNTWWATIQGAALAVAFGVAGTVRGAIIAYDDLEDASLGSLGGQTSGTGFTAGYVLTSGAVGVVTNQSLSYSSGPISVDGGTNAIYVAYPDKTTVFTRAISTQNGDSLYLSFLFRTPTADGNSEDFLSFGPNSTTAETSAGVIHRLNSSNSDHDFGIRYGTTDKRGTGGTETDRTYFVVLRLKKLTPGAANAYNELALFVDPSSVYEPSPSLVVTNSRWAAAVCIAARVALSEAGDGYFLDNLCIGGSYDDVVFPAGSPVVATPEISPPGGAVAGSLSVTITTATPGASIRYTTDGSTPSSTVGTVYTAPFDVASSATVKAIAYNDGMFDSPVSMAEYWVYKHWTGLGPTTCGRRPTTGTRPEARRVRM